MDAVFHSLCTELYFSGDFDKVFTVDQTIGMLKIEKGTSFSGLRE